MRFTNELSRATNREADGERVRLPLTSVEQRLRDMDKMGVDVQAISCSPFQFMYSLDPGSARKTARADQREPRRDRRTSTRTASWRWRTSRSRHPTAAAEELDYCVRRLGFRGVEIGTNVAGKEISRGPRRASGRRRRSSTSWCSCTPTGFTGGERLVRSLLHQHHRQPARLHRRDRPPRVRRHSGNVPEAEDRVGARRRLRLALSGPHGPRVGRPRRPAHGPQAEAPPVARQALLRRSIVFDREQLRHLVNLVGRRPHRRGHRLSLRHGLVRSTRLRRRLHVPEGRATGRRSSGSTPHRLLKLKPRRTT